MDSYDEMTGISIVEDIVEDIVGDIVEDIEKISDNGPEAVEQVKKLIWEEFPGLRISGPNGTKGIRYYSIQNEGTNMLILEDHCDKRTEKGLLTTPEKIKKDEFNKRGYDKLNWQDVFYGNRRKYDTRGKYVDEIRLILNHLITFGNT